MVVDDGATVVDDDGGVVVDDGATDELVDEGLVDVEVDEPAGFAVEPGAVELGAGELGGPVSGVSTGGRAGPAAWPGGSTNGGHGGSPWDAAAMNLLQIDAGKVPPATCRPWTWSM